ncbi:DUF4381 domain-containing protein [Agarivorans sp. DSG3-1]|uniref:DUF4381 domain-containing protein n=1 Tax=Agarivorans sp. DSG3-1 TaxID=3342249 RepID=UPI00398EB1A1
MPEQSTPLAQLKDIILPSNFETALPAVGWWVLAVALVLLLALSLFAAWRYKQLCKPRQEALQALKQQPMNLAGTNQLMKRLALSYYPRQQVASLSGKDWLSFLDSTYSGKQHAFIELQSQWQQQLYAADAPALDEDIAKLCKKWIKQLRPPLTAASLFGLHTPSPITSKTGGRHV